MARKSIYELACKDTKIKKMMDECYYDANDEENKTKFISTNVMSINLLFSGQLNGGIPMGKMSMVSAPSMLGKTFIAMSTVINAQKKGMQVVIIDTERAFSIEMAESLGIDTSIDKLFIFQDSSIEKLITFILNIVDGMTKDERLNTLFVMDSWGTLITSKTTEDGLKGKDVMDMTEAKKKNKLANIILNTKATWLIINHVYDNIGGFGDALSIPGGRKIMFNCTCVLLGMTRAKHKEVDKKTKDEVIAGHIITARAQKSRHSRELAKLKFRIKHDGGLDPYFGILEDAIAGGYVQVLDTKPKKFIRSHIKDDEKFVTEAVYTSKFWAPILNDTDFKEYIESRYKYGSTSFINTDYDAITQMIND